MILRVEAAAGGGAVLVVEHADGGRTVVAEYDGMTAVLSLDAFHVRQMRYSITNTAGAAKRRRRPAARPSTGSTP